MNRKWEIERKRAGSGKTGVGSGELEFGESEFGSWEIGDGNTRERNFQLIT